MNKSNNVSLRIILLFSILIALSFVPEYYHLFFGDWYCQGSTWVAYEKVTQYYGHQVGCMHGEVNHQPVWHWGYRHWLYFSMGICLSIVQFFGIVKVMFFGIVKVIDK